MEHTGSPAMKKMRIVWLSNKALSECDRGATGTWLDAMARGLVLSEQVQLANIAQGQVSVVSRSDCGDVQQWLVPNGARPKRGGLPGKRHVTGIIQAVEAFSPDLMHVWGTEVFWGLLSARRLLGGPALLEMQGLKSAIALVYSGGLSVREQLACVGIKEVLKFSPMWRGRKQFARWGKFEREIIRGHRFVTVPSDWLESRIRAINPLANVLRNDLALREQFCTAQPWAPQNEPEIFCSAAYPSPFKGIHVAIRALALLKPMYPGVQLRVAGPFQRPGLRQEGYVAWLNREAEWLGVQDRVHWLGPLPAQAVVTEMQRCAAVVLPTFVEGSSVVLAEAMRLGVPCVASFVGGTSSLARDEDSALFFPPGDADMCAFQVGRLLGDRELAQRLSRRSRGIALVRNDGEAIVSRQLSIYRQVLAGNDVAGHQGES